MSRLIDADLLKQNCKITGDFQNNFQCVDLITLGSVIDAQPTAFDLKEVVKQLEVQKAIAFITLANSSDAALDASYRNVIAYLDRAIEIVKGGKYYAEP